MNNLAPAEKGFPVSEQYKLLSKAVASGFGPCRWVTDESIPICDRVLKKGFSSGLTVVADPHDAAKIFADFLAEWEHGDEYSAHLVVPHAKVANGIIFQMQPGTPCPAGGYLLESHFFAVLVTNEEDQDARNIAGSIG